MRRLTLCTLFTLLSSSLSWADPEPKSVQVPAITAETLALVCQPYLADSRQRIEAKGLPIEQVCTAYLSRGQLKNPL